MADFGQNEFDLLCVVFVLCCVLSVWRGYCFTVSGWGFMCGSWFQGLVWTALLGTALPLDRPSPGPALPLDPPKISGLAHDSPRAQTCTLKGPGTSNTTKFPREDPQREKKE